MKYCTRCRETKPLTEFGKHKGRNKDNVTAFCRPCHRQAVREQRAADPQCARERQAATRSKNPERYAEYARNFRDRNRQKLRDKARNYKLVKKYGITAAEYDQILSSQGGVCAICKRLPENKRRHLHVDHCHSGAIRSLLCAECNVLLGMAEDSPERLINAAEYLKGHLVG